MEHHPIFNHFKSFVGLTYPGIEVCYLGDRYPRECLMSSSRWFSFIDWPLKRIQKPKVDEEYFEWIDVLEAAEAAQGKFSMIELGAGYGRWSIRGYLAARQRGIKQFRIVAVEPEPQHANWLRGCFQLNGMGEESFQIHEAAVSDTAGTRYLVVLPPKHASNQLNPRTWHGQYLMPKDCAVAVEPAASQDVYFGHKVVTLSDGWRAIEVPVVTLNDLLDGEEVVDLIDVDIQSEECDVIKSSKELLKQKARRLHIGTHSRDIEAALTDELSRAGWLCNRAYACHSVADTPYGRVSFQDGVQSWINSGFN